MERMQMLLTLLDWSRLETRRSRASLSKGLALSADTAAELARSIADLVDLVADLAYLGLPFLRLRFRLLQKRLKRVVFVLILMFVARPLASNHLLQLWANLKVRNGLSQIFEGRHSF